MSYFYPSNSQYIDSAANMSSSPPSSSISPNSSSSLATSPGGYHPSSSYSLSYSMNGGMRSPYTASSNNNNNNQTLSRASSVSPTLSPSARNYPTMTWKDRFEASRGFDLEDDMEFCPLVCYPSAAAAAAPASFSEFYGAGGMVGVGASSASSPLGSPSHQYSNPFASAPGSSSTPSPTHGGLFTPNASSSSTYSHNTITYYPNNQYGSVSPSRPSSGNSHKARKGIQIVDPSTGLKIGSLSFTPAGMAKTHRV